MHSKHREMEEISASLEVPLQSNPLQQPNYATNISFIKKDGFKPTSKHREGAPSSGSLSPILVLETIVE